jgi:nucleoside-diphosphate-sugar epimerase
MSGQEQRLVFISGMSGVVGSGLTAELLRRLPGDVRIAGLFRSRGSYLSTMAALPVPEDAKRITPVYGDLGKPADMPDIAASLPRDCALIGVHCAADVAWDKSMPEVYDLNVEGSLRFAELIAAGGAKPGMIYVSSAYTRAHEWTYRNGYEESKAAGERAIRERHPRLPVTTFSCSLVIGDSEDGAIARYHGIYPLIKMMACLTPPFLVGRPDCLIDLVPVDWVSKELARQTLLLLGGEPSGDVVAAAGEQRIRMDRMVSVIAERVNRMRTAHGFERLAPLTFLPYRRWAFLRRSLEKWQPKELPVQDFRYFERLLEVYKPYTESDAVLPPQNTRFPCPDTEAALVKSVDHWLDRHAELVRARLKRGANIAAAIRPDAAAHLL